MTRFVCYILNSTSNSSRTEQNEIQKRLLGLVSGKGTLGLGLVSGVNRLLGLGISLARALKILLSLGLNPPNRDRAPSTLGSFAGLPVTVGIASDCWQRMELETYI